MSRREGFFIGLVIAFVGSMAVGVIGWYASPFALALLGAAFGWIGRSTAEGVSWPKP